MSHHTINFYFLTFYNSTFELFNERSCQLEVSLWSEADPDRYGGCGEEEEWRQMIGR